jgi:hypothetical protein
VPHLYSTVIEETRERAREVLGLAKSEGPVEPESEGSGPPGGGKKSGNSNKEKEVSEGDQA